MKEDTRVTNLPTHVRRPVVNFHQGLAHACGTLCIRELISDPERLNAWLVGQQSHCPGPVGAPQASFKTERLAYRAQRLPDVLARVGLGCSKGIFRGCVPEVPALKCLVRFLYPALSLEYGLSLPGVGW